MKRRYFCVATLCLTAALLFSGCGDDAQSHGDHGHTHASEVWEVDADGHWLLDTSGAKVHEEAHTLEDDSCTVCGADVIDNGDGTTDVFGYNQRGDCNRLLVVAADGTLLTDQRFEHAYMASGALQSQKTYEDGVLTGEAYYALDAARKQYVTKQVFYAADGGETVYEYNVNGDLVRDAYVDANGKTVYDTVTAYTYDKDGHMLTSQAVDLGKPYQDKTYALDANGKVYCKTCTEYYSDGSKDVSENNEYGDAVVVKRYRADGSVMNTTTFEYVYDADGSITHEKEFADGVLTHERWYVVDEHGISDLQKEVSYDENGVIPFY